MEQNWNTKYQLNIPVIDEQHKGFVELWEQEYKRADTNNQEKLFSLIEKLEKYLVNHFKTEEELMKKSGYEDIESHIRQHEFFIEKVEEMKQDFQYGNTMLFEKLMMFMKKWFFVHILQTDKGYQKSIETYFRKEKK